MTCSDGFGFVAFAIGQAQLLEDDEVFRCSLGPRANTHVNAAAHSSGGIDSLIGEFIASVSANLIKLEGSAIHGRRMAVIF